MVRPSEKRVAASLVTVTAPQVSVAMAVPRATLTHWVVTTEGGTNVNLGVVPATVDDRVATLSAVFGSNDCEPAANVACNVVPTAALQSTFALTSNVTLVF